MIVRRMSPLTQDEIKALLAVEQEEDNLPALSVDEYCAQNNPGGYLGDVAEIANFADKIAQQTGAVQVILYAGVRLVCRPGSTPAHAVMAWAQDQEFRRDERHAQELAAVEAKLAKASKEGA